MFNDTIFNVIQVDGSKISFRDVKRLDINSEFLGVPPEKLMEAAGKGVAEEIKKRVDGGKVVVLVGTGNNGGDGLVAARHLSEMGFDVEVILAKGDVKTPLARRNLDALPPAVKVLKYGGPEWLKKEIEGADVLVDALLGVGLSGFLREPYEEIVSVANDFKGLKVSVDVPSGIAAFHYFHPDLTVTFHNIKREMIGVGVKKKCGEIVVKDIGIPEEADLYTGPGELALFPPTPKKGHKGDGGVVMVVGGGPYTGAPILSSLAAIRGGADLVFLAVPDGVYPMLAGRVPEIITIPLPTRSGRGLRLDNAAYWEVRKRSLLHKIGGILVGPGAGRDEETLSFMEGIIELRMAGPLVVDADGIEALSRMVERGFRFVAWDKVVVTPHRGEYNKLADALGESKDLEPIDMAKMLNATILLKGPEDVIASPYKVRYNRTGNPAMTVGGTGDLLSGLTVALLTRDMTSFDAASLAAYSLGLIGDKVFREKGYSLTPSDILNSYFIPADPRGYVELARELEG
ncbi:MAG: NAD(P)H-hydrate dehydratase [Thermoplasmata archaeon]|nr:NAD(P)H-hydrate dehydratase [Thermoplasmata archaeon]